MSQSLCNNPLVSVVVAVYNAEVYISDCIQSILAQTYENTEIILVNDGSTDTSGLLCDTFARNNDKISVINKINGGAAQARNAGIKKAKGDFVAFVDSDDTIEPEYIEVLMRNAVTYSADISVCGYYNVYPDGGKVQRVANKPTLREYDNVAAIRDHLLEGSVLEPMLCNKLYRRQLFEAHNLWFPEGAIYEDSRNLYRLYYYSRKVVFENKPLYLYLQRPGSVMRNGVSMRNIELLYLIPREANAWLEQRDVHLKNETNVYLSTSDINILNYMVDSNDIRNDVWVETVARIRNSLSDYLGNPKMSIKRKATLLLAVFFGLKFYSFVRKRYSKGY